MHRRVFIAMGKRRKTAAPSDAPASGASGAPSSASADGGGQSASAATTTQPDNPQRVGSRPRRATAVAAPPAAPASPAAAAAPVPATAPVPGDVTAPYMLSGAADGAMEVHDDSEGDDSGGGSADEKDDGIAAVGTIIFLALH